MDEKTVDILDQSIRQELLVSECYSLFGKFFRDDSEFWNKLSEEELNHSAILKAERDSFYEIGLLPEDIVQAELETLRKNNSLISSLLDKLRITAPSREQTFSIACALENLMIESIYESCLAKYPETSALKIFQSINLDEHEHIERIHQYASRIEVNIDNSGDYFSFDE